MKSHNNEQDQSIEVPFAQLAPETLRSLIEDFVSRDGSDWDQRGCSLDDKVDQVMRQLERRQVRVVFDFSSQTANLVPVLD